MAHDTDLDDLPSEETEAEVDDDTLDEAERFHRQAEIPEAVRFDEERLKRMTVEELRGHIRILYFRQDQFIAHFGKLHSEVYRLKGYNPSALGRPKKK